MLALGAPADKPKVIQTRWFCPMAVRAWETGTTAWVCDGMTSLTLNFMAVTHLSQSLTVLSFLVLCPLHMWISSLHFCVFSFFGVVVFVSDSQYYIDFKKHIPLTLKKHSARCETLSGLHWYARSSSAVLATYRFLTGNIIFSCFVSEDKKEKYLRLPLPAGNKTQVYESHTYRNRKALGKHT